MSDRNLSRFLEAPFAAPRLTLCLVVLALVLLGSVVVFSTTYVASLNLVEAASAIADAGAGAVEYAPDSRVDSLVKQALFAVIGIVFVALMHLVPQACWRTWIPYLLMVLAVAIILFTMAYGSLRLGATRTVVIGSFSVQPTEFCKIAFVVMAGKIAADYREGALGSSKLLLAVFVLIIVPLMMLYKFQSDLGGTMIIAVGCLAVLWFSEVPLRYIVVPVAVAVAFVVLSTVLTEYRSDRMLFLDPWNDGGAGSESGLQNIRASYAFAGGGLLGVGLGNSHEKFNWLSESETDLAFAIVGEELGLVGAMVVILLFLALLAAGLYLSRSCDDTFARVVSGGLVVMLVFQAFLNMGCCAGILPITGKPLPFISKGGSSLLASILLIGVILCVTRASGEPQRRRRDLRVVRAESSSSLSPDDFHAVGTRGSARGRTGHLTRSQGRGTYGSPGGVSNGRSGSRYGRKG